MTAHVRFCLGDQRYALAIDLIAEIIPFVIVNRVPNMPSDWRGVANIRGRITPVIDLRVHYGLSPLEPTHTTPLIVLVQGTSQVALLVDEVEDVIHDRIEHTTITLQDGQLMVVIEAQQFFENLSTRQL